MAKIFKGDVIPCRNSSEQKKLKKQMEETDNKRLHQFLWESLESYADKDKIDDEFVLSFEFETGYTYSIKYIDLKKSIEGEE